MQEKTINIESSDQMEEFGFNLGKKVLAGTCIELSSDLGGGKTTFTRGLVRGMGSIDNVTSPTFTISKQYKGKNLNCYHFDFYRLQEPGLIKEELRDALIDPNGVVVVEWADSVIGVMPEDRISIKINRVADDAEVRSCIIKYPEVYKELVGEIL